MAVASRPRTDSPRSLAARAAGLALALALLPAPVRAQLIDRYFPQGVPGYGAEPGVTVQSRAREAYDPPGVRLGGIILRPTLSTALGTTSNATGQPAGRPSALAQTSGSLLAGTNWGRHAIGGYLGIDDQRVVSASAQSGTAWTAALGGTMEIGRDQLALGAAHLDLFQSARALNSLALDRPGRFRVNNARAAYTWRSGRLSIAPGLSLTDTSYDDVFIGGRRVVQRYRDRLATEGNVTTRWQLAPLRDLVLDLRAVGFTFARREPGQPSRNATAVALLAGIDYATDAVWRVRALAGVQHRSFADPSLRAITGPMAEASLIWSPSGLTTVTATLSRRIEDAAELSALTYAFTGGRLVVDHELQRNLLLAASIDLQRADTQQRGGHETLLGLGLGATWLMNRQLRTTASWDWTTRRRSDGIAVQEGIALLRLRVAM